MNAAFLKNLAAIDSMLGNKDLSNRVQSIRIGVFSQGESVSKSGNLLAEALGEVIGRLWKNIDVVGPYVDQFRQSAYNAAFSGEQSIIIQSVWSPPYDFVIAIGAQLPEGTQAGICVGASGWKAYIGDTVLSDLANPIGPAIAAALASAELLKTVFKEELGERAISIPKKYMWEVWGFDKIGIDETQTPDLVFQKLHVFGVGAVTHGFMWLLERWPALVSGEIDLIDHDKYDFSNGQRYIGMNRLHVSQPKTVIVADRLRTVHKNITIHPQETDINSYFAEKQRDCRINLALIGVDSAEHRRHLALKLPKRVINMWTEGERLGASRFGFSDGWACLYCAYPDKRDLQYDETSEIHRETGLMPSRVRELLFSGSGLTHDDVMTISQRYMLPDLNSLVGKPLRSVRGTLCATGRIHLKSQDTDTDVPFAFASFLAGIGGFIEFIHEILQSYMSPGHWQMNVLKYPTIHSWGPRAPVDDCYLCSDPIVDAIIEK